MLLLDERIRSDGSHARTWASWDGRFLHIQEDAGPPCPLPRAALDQVMSRYGQPLEDGVSANGDSLSCGDFRLARLQFRAIVDAEPRDYLVWERPGQPPIACVAATVTAALWHLARRLGGAASGI